jgi:hypothetical protein
MNDLPENDEIQDDHREGYPVLPASHSNTELFPFRSTQPPKRIGRYKPRFQYSIADMIKLTVCVATFASILATISSWMPFAGLMYVGAVGCLVMLFFSTPEQLLLRISWVVMFVLFLVVGIVVECFIH